MRLLRSQTKLGYSLPQPSSRRWACLEYRYPLRVQLQRAAFLEVMIIELILAGGRARRNRLGGQIEVRQQCAQDEDASRDIRWRIFLVCVHNDIVLRFVGWLLVKIHALRASSNPVGVACL